MMKRLVFMSLAFLLCACGGSEESSGSDATGSDGGDSDISVTDAADGTGADGTDAEPDEGPADVPPPPVTLNWIADDLDLSEEYVLHSIWGTDHNNLVAVGTKATIIENHGSGWEVVHQDLELDTLNGVWGSSINDVWAVGAHGQVLHRDAAGWAIVDPGCKGLSNCEALPTLWDVWGTGPDNVYAVGNGGTINHWNGESWNSQSDGEANDLFAVSGNESVVAAVGDLGETFTNYSGAFATGSAGVSSQLLAIEALSGDESIAVGTSGSIVRHTAAGWFPESSGTFVDLRGIWSDGQNSVAVGKSGTALHSAASGVWSPKSSGTSSDLNDVNGSMASDLYAVGAGGLLLHYDGSTWSKVGNLVAEDLLALEQLGAGGAVFAVGAGGTVVSDVSGIWEKTITPTTADLLDVWGADPQNLWAVGNLGVIIRWNGTKWVTATSPTELNLHGIWGRSADEIYAVGEAGVLLRYEDETWTIVRSNTSVNLRSVWGMDDQTVFAVGAMATIMRYNGVNWSQQVVEDEVSGGQLQPVVSELFGIWGASPDDLWAVGADGTMINYSKDPESGDVAWIKVPQQSTGIAFRGIWGTGKDSMFLVGREGSVIKFNGQSLQKQNTGIIATLYDVTGFSETSVFAVGDLGTVLRSQVEFFVE